MAYSKNTEPTRNSYPSLYMGSKPVLEQIEMLLRLFPQIDPTETFRFAEEQLPSIALPEGAEGWFAVPRWQKVAENYGSAAEIVRTMWRETHFWQEYWVSYSSGNKHGRECITSGWRRPSAEQIKPDRIRQHPASALILNEIGRTQRGEILLIPAQHGLRHRSRDVFEARQHFAPNEFGLGIFAGLCMALTHPERYSYVRGCIAFLGDESAARDEPWWSRYKAGDFAYVPAIIDENECATLRLSEASAGVTWGEGAVVSGFLPNV